MIKSITSGSLKYVASPHDFAPNKSFVDVNLIYRAQGASHGGNKLL